MIPTPAFRQKDDANEKCYFETFKAEEVIDILHKVFDKHITPKETKTQIISSMNHNLLFCSWERKALLIIT
jgi:hypothetical protein